MKKVIGPSGKKYKVKHRKSTADNTIVIEVYSNLLYYNVYTHYTNSYNASRIVEFYKDAVKAHERAIDSSADEILAEWDGDCRE